MPSNDSDLFFIRLFIRINFMVNAEFGC